MADTPKKRTSTPKASAEKPAAAAKPRKTAPKKSAAAETANPVAPNGHAAVQGRSASHEDVARLAHKYWQQRGHKHGHHEEDWYRAEQELRGKAS